MNKMYKTITALALTTLLTVPALAHSQQTLEEKICKSNFEILNEVLKDNDNISKGKFSYFESYDLVQNQSKEFAQCIKNGVNEEFLEKYNFYQLNRNGKNMIIITPDVLDLNQHRYLYLLE